MLSPSGDRGAEKLIGTKLIEIVAQAAAATTAGGLLVQAYLKWHSRELAIMDFRRAILDGLIKEYMDAKRTRRILRASSTQDGSGTEENPWTHVPMSAYGENMMKFNDTQLALEVLTRRIEVFASVVPNAPQVASQAKSMQDYLASVVTEYEKHRIAGAVNHQGVPLSGFPALRGFMPRKDASTFDLFADPYHTILRELHQGAVRVSV